MALITRDVPSFFAASSQNHKPSDPLRYCYFLVFILDNLLNKQKRLRRPYKGRYRSSEK